MVRQHGPPYEADTAELNVRERRRSDRFLAKLLIYQGDDFASTFVPEM